MVRSCVFTRRKDFFGWGLGVGKLLRKMLSPANSAEPVGMVAPAELLACLARVKTVLY